MNNKNWRFAIIGGGLTATSMLTALVKRLGDVTQKGFQIATKIEIDIYERSNQIGPGLPHSDQSTLPFHITNMCAGDMSIVQDDKKDFQKWVEDNAPRLSADYPVFFNQRTCPECELMGGGHYPRSVMGRYLKDKIEWAARLGRSLGLNIAFHMDSEVTSLILDGPGLRICLGSNSKDGSGHYYDVALLATGHWFPSTDIPRYLPSPWPAKRLLEEIPPGEKVGVLGSSLSAIEVALTFTSDGRFARQGEGIKFIPAENSRGIVLHSRSGLLPAVRGRLGKRINRFLTNDNLRRLLTEKHGSIRLEEMYDLLVAELIDAYGKPFDCGINQFGGLDAFEKLRLDISRARFGDAKDGTVLWQTIINQVFPLARELYLGLSSDERIRFDREYGTLFFIHAATQPMINAEKILALYEAGVLEVVTLGNNYSIEHRNDCHALIYHREKNKQIVSTYRYLVNATGQSRDIRTNQSELFDNLIANGQVDFHSSSATLLSKRDDRHYVSLKIEPKSHRVLIRQNNKSEPSGSLFAVGAMTRNQLLDVSMAAGLVRSTDEIAQQLVSDLVTRT